MRDRSLHYKLDSENRPVVCSMTEWAIWWETTERHVADTHTQLMRISTVFLGLDYNFSDRGPPILFETMVFDRYPHMAEVFGEMREVFEDYETHRYATWDDALASHKAIVKRIAQTERQHSELVLKLLEGAAHE